MDVGGKVTSGAVTERRSRSDQAKTGERADTCMDVNVRATHDYKEVRGRAMPGAIAEEAKAEFTRQ